MEDLTTGKQILRALKAAEAGCRTSAEVSAMTGMSINLSSHWISELIKSGTLKRNGLTKRCGRGGASQCFEVAQC